MARECRWLRKPRQPRQLRHHCRLLQHFAPSAVDEGMSTTERDAASTASLLLTVVEGLTVPRGTACIGAAALAALEAQPGDVIEIAAERVTVAQVDRWSDDPTTGPGGGALTIAMDGLVRQNAGAALGAEVRVRRVYAPPAVSAALVPAGEGS